MHHGDKNKMHTDWVSRQMMIVIFDGGCEEEMLMQPYTTRADQKAHRCR